MMFPVNRKASELTVTELLNLYDEMQRRCLAKDADEAQSIIDSRKELRAEIERRMQPCSQPHTSWNLQQQAAQGLGQFR